ncbi:unnamed protein product, partial [Allacma fusca]
NKMTSAQIRYFVPQSQIRQSQIPVDEDISY